MRPLHFLAALLLAFAALATEAHAKPAGPTEQFMANFFDAYFNGGKHGLHALAPVEPYLSPRLKQAIAQAKSAEKASAAVTPYGDKPCLLEGDIFFGVYEGADNFQVTRVRHYQGKRYVRVRLGLAEPYDPYYWEATLVLTGKHTLLLDDVAWDDGMTLLSNLEQHCKADIKPKATPLQPAPAPTAHHCKVGGCSGQLCTDASDEAMASTCEFRPEYACYRRLGVCERQPDGACGWTPSSILQDCLKNPLTPTN